MPDFAQQYATVVSPTPVFNAGAPVIALVGHIQNSVQFIANPVCDRIYAQSSIVIGIGASLELLAATINARYYLHYFEVKSSVAGVLSLRNGASVMYEHTFVAAEVRSVIWPNCGLRTPNLNTSISLLNGTGVAVTVDVAIYAGSMSG